ncbi:hypothetical protein FHG87_006181 [Trinorchestia longiramus]|nr:hypothetical protein FHG87_006181 [Trinorchestia longiramus]
MHTSQFPHTHTSQFPHTHTSQFPHMHTSLPPLAALYSLLPPVAHLTIPPPSSIPPFLNIITPLHTHTHTRQRHHHHQHHHHHHHHQHHHHHHHQLIRPKQLNADKFQLYGRKRSRSFDCF